MIEFEKIIPTAFIFIFINTFEILVNKVISFV